MSKEHHDDDIPLMTAEAQDFYINCLIFNHRLYALVQHVVSPVYFDESLRETVTFIKKYFSEQKSLPSKELITLHTKFKPFSENPISETDINYIANEIAQFCKFRAVIQEVMNAPQMIKDNDLGALVKRMTEATQIQLHTDLGIEYFSDVEQRILTASEKEVLISTGWQNVDADVYGVGRQELILFLAPSGGGKSVGMVNFGFNLIRQNMNGVYISLEMRDSLVAKRLDAIISKVSAREHLANLQRVVDEVELFGQRHTSKFYVKRMRESSTSANDIAAYINQLQLRTGVKVDFIIIDYIDLMRPNEKVDNGNIFVKEKFIAEEVRGLGLDFDAIMVSACQLGRDAWEVIRQGKDLGQDHLQGGMSKINTSDLAIAVVKDEAMDAMGQIKFQYLKSRNSGAVGRKRMMSWSPVTLRIDDLTIEDHVTIAATHKAPLKSTAKSKNTDPLAGFLKT